MKSGRSMIFSSSGKTGDESVYQASDFRENIEIEVSVNSVTSVIPYKYRLSGMQ